MENSDRTNLKVGSTIKLIESGETFIIDKIFKDGYVDMTSTKEFNPYLGLHHHEKFFSIWLVSFEIIN